MEDGSIPTIRDTPLGSCIGHTLVEITSDDAEEFLADPKNKNRVYLHFSNGETIFCTLGTEENSGLVGMLGTEDDEGESDADGAQQ